MNPSALDSLLERLAEACAEFDLAQVAALLRQAPLDYQAPLPDCNPVVPFPEPAPPPGLRVIAKAPA